jgi:hypothetical protein
MAYKALVAAVGLVMATSAAASTQPVPPAAPPGDAHTLYCMRVEAHTGSRIETVECWTREEWALGDVDVDKDWPENGVRVLNG